jgi:hypothetical protein
MTPNKYRAIKNKFFGSQEHMATSLQVSQAKISEVMAGKSDLKTESIKLLIEQYRISPNWIFLSSQENNVILLGEGEPETDSLSLHQKYIAALEKVNALLEEKSQWQDKSKDD